MRCKLQKISLIITIIVAFSGCSKSDSDTTVSPANPYGGNNGQVTFWCSNVNRNVYPVTINIDGKYIGTIGGATTTAPDCDNASNWVVKFTAAPGTYNTYATSAVGGNWTGTITITNATCQTQQLQ